MADTPNQRPLDILVVDDEPRIRQMVQMCLSRDGHEVSAVSTAQEAEGIVNEHVFHLIFLDLRLKGASGMDLIPQLLDEQPEVKIVIITAHASIESAVEAMRRGAVDYLPKPFSPEQVRAAVHKVENLLNLEHHVDTLQSELAQARPQLHVQSESEEMQEALGLARQVASSEATVLLRGESGTGKTVLARAIHQWSSREDRPFVVVHCPSIPGDLFESELFGHVKGAYTGAVHANAGRVAQAEGGTLFLDEVGDLPYTLQPKLLRFVQERVYERVGDPQTQRANVRIIAATNQDLGAAVDEGAFREDLFYRLNVVDIQLPPLRRRVKDILPLAAQFLDYYTRKYNRSMPGFSKEARRLLRGHDWPGNVRELQNVVERAVILGAADEITPEELPIGRSGTSSDSPRVGEMVSLEALEEAHIQKVIGATETLEEAADVLGIDPATLWRRRKKYSEEDKEF